ncbi:uncharacterized protein DUF4993 [Sphingobacterium allocomposti]|uniref:Uncharacterized protein DUF4993 n=1 Tax=Sphingobacterium allocomposti TaxID=415956 RepID=A0A5S5DSM6_9SPHI|nr:fasciclin domain-containing protein [Sphingobacterium composti Yoo et al. 2007 non Ten et al. 2007]TYP98378.1 uncharacterized protein DUF4993 [Sphingobacterium composti Yoo et al. 2007 non Ten et al. 2007]
MRIYKLTFHWVVFAVLCISCRKEAFDDYYSRPDDLESPIYTRLEEEGRFSHFRRLIEKAGYMQTLNQAGYWTLFAPNDDAVHRFLQEHNYATVEEVPDAVAEQIVRYALVYNAFQTNRIADYQSNLGWQEGMGFRRRTAYYDGFRKEKVKINGTEREIIVGASNRNNVTVNFGTPYYVDGDNNNKYVTYFHEKYRQFNSLSADDYSFFHPSISTSNFHFMGGSVAKADIIAENGVIHEVDVVTLPRPSLDQYLRENEEYSFFRDSVLNQFFVTYEYSPTASKTYEYRTGQVAEVYIKVYDPLLAFSPNNENFLKEEDNDGQRDGYSMFIPTNDVIVPWIRNVFLEHYKTLNRVPKGVLADFVNTMLWQSAVWPSQFSTKTNLHEEPARFTKADIIDKQIVSNGFFYGTNKIQESDLFNTVYRHVILDPEYSLMLMLLEREHKRLVINPGTKFTLFLFSNSLLNRLGYSYNERLNEWSWIDRNGNTMGHGQTQTRLARLLYSHIIETPNDELANINNTQGFIQTGDRALPGEFIKWKNGNIYAAGNERLQEPVRIIGTAKFGNNGRVYYVDNLLEFSNETAGEAMARIAAENPNVSRFWEYVSKSPLYVANDRVITGVAGGSLYTLLMPNNEAVQQAIDDGVLPPDPATGDIVGKFQIESFIRYHILTNVNVAPDGNQDILSAVTLAKNVDDESLTVNVSNAVGNLRFVDRKGRTVSTVYTPDLYLSDRIVLHELNGYLNYNN